MAAWGPKKGNDSVKESIPGFTEGRNLSLKWSPAMNEILKEGSNQDTEYQIGVARC